MSALIVFCIIAIIAIIAIFGYNTLSKAECSQDTDCKPSYKCQSGKCIPVKPVTPGGVTPGGVTPVTPGGVTPGGVTPCTSADCVVCNSDNCTLPNTCQNNQCVSPCSLTNCASPKICQNNKCITPICTPEQIAKIFPPSNSYMDMGDSTYGPCTGIDDKYLSFDKTWAIFTTNRINIPTTTADGCKTACDKNPNCTAWIHDTRGTTRGGLTGCQLSTSIINPPTSVLNEVVWELDGLGQFNYNKDSPMVYSTNVKIAALV